MPSRLSRPSFPLKKAAARKSTKRCLGFDVLEKRDLLATIHVGSDSTVQDLLQASQVAEDGDTLVLASEVFEGGVTFGQDRLTIVGAGIDVSVIDGMDEVRPITITGRGVTLRDLTIRNGLSGDLANQPIRGGGLTLHGSADVSHVKFLGNKAMRAGGAIAVVGSKARLRLSDSILDSNVAARDRSGQRVQFGNSLGFGGVGSAILVADGAGADLYRNVFENNQTWSSSVVYADSISVPFLWPERAYAEPATVTMVGNSFIGNYANVNGVVRVDTSYSSVLVANNSFARNYGVAIHVESDSGARVLNNSIDRSGGVRVYSARNAVILNNTISNAADGIMAAPESALVDFNNTWNVSNPYGVDVQPGSNRTSFDPQFVDVANGDLTLQPTSQLIGAGSDDPAYAADGGDNIGITGGIFRDRFARFRYLPEEVNQTLTRYLMATTRRPTDPDAVNLDAGMPHTAVQVGRYRTTTDGGATWTEHEAATRGLSSHTVPNEVALDWRILATMYKDGLRDNQTEQEFFDATWGYIKTGLETFEGIVATDDPSRFTDNMLYRVYLTTPPESANDPNPDRNLQSHEVITDVTEQSSDDNALFASSLFDLFGLVGDPNTSIPDDFRSDIQRLIHDILGAIDGSQFFRGDELIFNWSINNEGEKVPSTKGWDRRSAEGPIVAAGLLLASPHTIDIDDFNSVLPSFVEHATTYDSLNYGDIEIAAPVFQGQAFPSYLRQVHSWATLPEEAPGVTFAARTTLPTLMVHRDYADEFSLTANGDHVMNLGLNDYALNKASNDPDRDAVLPGNEFGEPAELGENMPRVTTISSLLQPLGYFRELDAAMVFELMDDAALYEERFFLDDDEGLGWLTAVPFRHNSTDVGWVSDDDGIRRFSDAGDFYSTIHNQYLYFALRSALNPDDPIRSYNAHSQRLDELAALVDSGKQPTEALFATPGVEFFAQNPADEIAEGGPTVQYRVRLASQPTADVTLSLTTDEQLNASSTTFEFDADDWDQWQSLTIAAIDDIRAEGPHEGTLEWTASSSDLWYFNHAETVTVGIADNDVDFEGSWLVQDGQSGTAPDDSFNAVAIGRDGTLIAAGTAMAFGDSGNHPGDGDVVVAQYANDGTLLRRYQVGGLDDEGDNQGDDDDRVADVAIDDAGNIYVAGGFRSSEVDFDPTGTHPEDKDVLVSAGSFDGFLLKLNNRLEFQWVVGLGGGSGHWDRAAAVAVDGDKVYVAGTFGGTIDFDRGLQHEDNHDRITSAGGTDAYVAVYDLAGQFQAVTAVGGSLRESASTLEIADDGAVYLAGTFEGTVDFDRQNVHADGSDVAQSEGGADAFILQLEEMAFANVMTIGGTGYQNVAGLAVDAERNVYASGLFQSSVDFDPGIAEHVLSSINGGFDAFYLRISAAGELAWVRTAGGAGDDRGRDIALDHNGNVAVAGAYNRAAGFIRIADENGRTINEIEANGAGSDDVLALASDDRSALFAVGHYSDDVQIKSGDESLSLLNAGAGKNAFAARLDEEFVYANTYPTITNVADQTTNEDQSTGAIDFQVGDEETHVDSLDVTATSSNESLLPVENIVLAGTGAERTVTLMPAADQYGAATVTVTVVDGHGAMVSMSFELQVTAANDAPTAVDDAVTVEQDSGATTIAVLANDSFAPDEDETLRVTGVTMPAHGTVENLGTGVAYTPDSEFVGTDTFFYTIGDGQGGSATAEVEVVVDPVASSTIVRLTLEMKDRNGNQISEVRRGQPFWVQLVAQDVSPIATGVFAAYADLGFDADAAEVTLPIFHSSDYSNGTSGSLAPGLVDELGGFGDSEPLGGNPRAVATVEFRATQAGKLSFTLDAADQHPDHHVLTYASPDAVPQAKIEYGRSEIRVVEGWQNPDNRFDVNADGLVAPNDVLAIIVRLNSGGSGPLPPPSDSQAPPPYLDVIADNIVAPNDVLAVINFINSGGAGEGESTTSFESNGPSIVVPFVQQTRIASAEESTRLGPETRIRRSSVRPFEQELRPSAARDHVFQLLGDEQGTGTRRSDDLAFVLFHDVEEVLRVRSDTTFASE